MPLPTPQPIERPSARDDQPRAARTLLFISYSHADWSEFVEEFQRFLILELRARRDIGFDETSIYLERDRIRAGDEWDEMIQQGLERSVALVFLVSDRSLMSRYCVQHELRYAVQNGLKIIPVILSDCPWSNQPLPGDQRNRVLGKIGGAPKDDQFNQVPINKWNDRDEAWTRTVRQIVDAIAAPAGERRTAEMPARLDAIQPQHPHLPELLPYLCDQQHAEGDVRIGLRAWPKSALLLFVKGIDADRPQRFWQRVRVREVRSVVVSRRKETLLEERPFVWPDKKYAAGARQHVEELVWEALSEAITGDMYRIGSPTQLADELKTLRGVLPLTMTLPIAPIEWLAKLMTTLIGLLDSCPEDAPLDRLVFGCLVEDERLVGAASILSQLGVAAPRRVHVIDPERITEFEPEDVRIWHRSNLVQNWTPLEEDEFVQSVFGGAGTIRFAGFTQGLQRLGVL